MLRAALEDFPSEAPKKSLIARKAEWLTGWKTFLRDAATDVDLAKDDVEAVLRSLSSVWWAREVEIIGEPYVPLRL